MPISWTTNRQFTAPAAAGPVFITPSGSSWGNSGYEELIASADGDLVITGLAPHGGDSVEFEADIAVGAAASEVVVTTFAGEFRNISSIGNNFMHHPLPLDNVPSGSRVSLRMRKSGTDTSNWAFTLTYFKKPLVGNLLTTAKPQKVAPANSRTTVTGATPTWVNGNWAQVIAAASADLVITGLVLPALSAATEWELDLGVGAAASEVVITTLRGRRASGNTDGPSYVPLRNPLSGKVLSGNRMAARIRDGEGSAGRQIALAVTYHEAPL